MGIQEVFSSYKSQLTTGQRSVQCTSLALRRGGIHTIEDLIRLNSEHPEKLRQMRGIGEKSMILIDKVLRFYSASTLNITA